MRWIRDRSTALGAAALVAIPLLVVLSLHLLPDRRNADDPTGREGDVRGVGVGQIPGEAGAPASSEMQIAGSGKFREQVRAALDLLRRRAPDAYGIVTKNIGRIAQGPHSAMWAYRAPPTFDLHDRTAFYSVTWCAGAIAHDSFHSKLYHDWLRTHGVSVPNAVWTGTRAEQRCLKHQCEVLSLIGAPEPEIEHCMSQKGDHHDVNNDGRTDWQDYEKGDW